MKGRAKLGRLHDCTAGSTVITSLMTSPSSTTITRLLSGPAADTHARWRPVRT